MKIKWKSCAFQYHNYNSYTLLVHLKQFCTLSVHTVLGHQNNKAQYQCLLIGCWWGPVGPGGASDSGDCLK